MVVSSIFLPPHIKVINVTTKLPHFRLLLTGVAFFIYNMHQPIASDNLTWSPLKQHWCFLPPNKKEIRECKYPFSPNPKNCLSYGNLKCTSHHKEQLENSSSAQQERFLITDWKTRIKITASTEPFFLRPQARSYLNFFLFLKKMAFWPLKPIQNIIKS